MAIEWQTQTSNENVITKRADVNFTRVDTDTGLSWSTQFHQAVVETEADWKKLQDAAWFQWQKEVKRRDDLVGMIKNYPQDSNTNLKSREV